MPWCVRKCPYCDFNSYTLRGDAAGSARTSQALERDIEAQAPQVRGRPVISIFFGGGTPSLFAPECDRARARSARRHLDVAADVRDHARGEPGHHRAGTVRRISRGRRQSRVARRAELRCAPARSTRAHSLAGTRRAARRKNCTRPAFRTSISISCTRCRARTPRAPCATSSRRWRFHPRISRTTSSPSSPARRSRPSRPALPADDAAAEMLSACHERLARAGFSQYEVSAYAAPGRQCRHNLNYWTFGDYLGVGAGAHGKTHVRRRRAHRPHHAAARAAPISGRARRPRSRASRVAAADLPFEFMMNALRLTEGFELALFAERTGLDWCAVEANSRRSRSRGLVVKARRSVQADPPGRPFPQRSAGGILTTKACFGR